MAFTTREYTNKLLELVDEGAIDPKELCQQLAMWLSEDEVADFWQSYGYAEAFEPEEEEEEDEDPMDDYNYVGSPHHY